MFRPRGDMEVLSPSHPAAYSALSPHSTPAQPWSTLTLIPPLTPHRHRRHDHVRDYTCNPTQAGCVLRYPHWDCPRAGAEAVSGRWCGAAHLPRHRLRQAQYWVHGQVLAADRRRLGASPPLCTPAPTPSRVCRYTWVHPCMTRVVCTHATLGAVLIPIYCHKVEICRTASPSPFCLLPVWSRSLLQLQLVRSITHKKC